MKTPIPRFLERVELTFGNHVQCGALYHPKGAGAVQRKQVPQFARLGGRLHRYVANVMGPHINPSDTGFGMGNDAHAFGHTGILEATVTEVPTPNLKLFGQDHFRPHNDEQNVKLERKTVL